jgi:hypothetical protein
LKNQGVLLKKFTENLIFFDFFREKAKKLRQKVKKGFHFALNCGKMSLLKTGGNIKTN